VLHLSFFLPIQGNGSARDRPRRQVARLQHPTNGYPISTPNLRIKAELIFGGFLMTVPASLKIRGRAGLALSASIFALAVSHNAHAQSFPLCADGTPGPICEIEVTGGSGPIASTNSNINIITNSGTITGNPAIAMGQGSGLVVFNEGTITGTSGVAINGAVRLLTYVENSGTINGSVVVTDQPAPSPFTSGFLTFISDGGTVNGDVLLGSNGFSRANFIQRGADDGVTGVITAGLGVDIYTRSYSSSQTLALGGRILPTTFDIEGFETIGTGTTLTLTGAGTSINLTGNGTVVNNATVNVLNTTALFPAGTVVVPEAIGYYQPSVNVIPRPQIQPGQPGSFFTIAYGNALTSFTNNGVINGDVNVPTASFLNTGDINLVTTSNSSTITTKTNSAFSFDNRGDIVLTVTGSRPASLNIPREFFDGFESAVRLRAALDTTAAADVTIANSGTIVGGIDGRFAAEDFVFVNSGEIEGHDIPNGYQVAGVVMHVGEISFTAIPGADSHYDAATASFTNTATGSIDHSTELFLSAYDASVVNDGFMAGADFSTDALSVEQYLDAEDIDATRFSFANSGTIEGSVELELQTTTVMLTNSGDVTGVGLAVNSNTFPDLMFEGGGVAFGVENETVGDQVVTFTNTGTIETVARAQSGVVLELDTEDEDDVGNPLPPIDATIAVVNSGTISATGGATLITPQFATFLEPNQFLVNPMAALVLDGSDVQASDITIENQVGGLIRAGGNLSVLTPNGYSPVPNPVNGVFTAAVLAAGRTITITNAGTIQGGVGTIIGPNIVLNTIDLPNNFLAGAIHTDGDEYGPDQVYIASRDTVTNTASGIIIGSIDLGGNDDTLTNNGQITGAVFLRDGDDVLANYGTLTGDVFFGAGNDTFTQSVSAVFAGTADGEAGEDKFFLDLTGGGTIDQTIYDRLLNFESFALIGQGQVDVDLGDEDDAFENDGTLEGDVSLGEGDNSFANTGTVEGDVTGGEGADDLGNDGTIEGEIDLGGGANEFTNNGTVTGNVSSGDDADTVENEGEIEGSVDLGSGDNELLNNGTITGDVTSGDGADDVENDGTIEGDVELGDGENQFANSGEVDGDVTAGNDDDVVTNSGTITGDVNLDEPEQDNQETFLRLARITTAAEAVVTGGDDVFTNTATLDGNLFAGAGNDAITNSGTITGDVDLGEGNDTLALQGAWVIGGNVSGGSGTDGLTIAVTGVAAEPQVLDLAGFTQFETLGLSGGTAIVQGGMTFGQINLTSGRLIGARESTITGNVAVAAGATFGSAGQVTGNIAVASGGTLSPGASPAIMSVTGNVSLAAGSSTLFEFVPAPGQSDQLLIDGNLTIAPGAVLNITGNRPLTPGVAYSLIVADSITGQFTLGTWDRSQVQGFLRYVDGTAEDRLQLLGTFVFQTTAAPQPTAAVNYVNSLLVAGTASSALLATISPLLDSSGFASAAAFTLLTPEPYASATQLGVENGLALARTSRSGMARSTGDTAGLFVFGSALGSWRGMDADGTLGTSRARNNLKGVIAGIGFGSETASLGGFVGYGEGRQRIAALGAQTNTDGMVAGVAGHVGGGGFNVDAMAAYDFSQADTSRLVPGNASVSSRYDLNSIVLDAVASYDVPLGGLALIPSAGITHISVRRDDATEAGSAAYGFNIDGDRHAATFVDGSIRIGSNATTGVRPWASVGLRHQLEGDLVFATAGLLGSAAHFTVPGAPRKDTVLTAGAGLAADLASNVSITASYTGEFGSGTGSTATVGLRARF